MDNEIIRYLWGLKEVNKALITGLEKAILVMDKIVMNLHRKDANPSLNPYSSSSLRVIRLMKPSRQKIEVPSDRVIWLASQIFSAFPQECTGLKLYSLDFDCIYYQRVFRDGELDPHIGITGILMMVLVRFVCSRKKLGKIEWLMRC